LCFNDYTKERENAIFNEKLKVHISPSSFRSTSFINTILLSKKEEVINQNGPLDVNIPNLVTFKRKPRRRKGVIMCNMHASSCIVNHSQTQKQASKTLNPNRKIDDYQKCNLKLFFYK